jgi:hypothetical protein
MITMKSKDLLVPLESCFHSTVLLPLDFYASLATSLILSVSLPTLATLLLTIGIIISSNIVWVLWLLFHFYCSLPTVMQFVHGSTRE